MFKFLKEKLGNWAKKLTQKESIKEEIEEPIVEIEEKDSKKRKKEKVKKKIVETKKEIEESKEIELPEKFNVALEKFEPDLEKVPEIEKKIEKEEKREEEIKQKEKLKEKNEEPEEKEEKQGFFARLKSKISSVEISEEDFNEQFEVLEYDLIENNVALEAIDSLRLNLKKNLVGKKILKKELDDFVKETLKDSLYKLLQDDFDLVESIKMNPVHSEKPYVILFFGINGSGKTTTIAKLADYLKNKKISCVLAAGDTFRAASIEQLNQHGKNLNIPVIAHEYGSDPASVGFDAIQYAIKNKIKCVLIDTAGRMHTSKDLLREMEKISRVTHPNLKIFIGESITGNDVIEQARQFNETIGIDGTILTKADVDEKGGTIISISYITKKPILFLGVGQNYGDLEPFNKNKFIEKLGL